jgi:hypothetical protein
VTTSTFPHFLAHGGAFRFAEFAIVICIKLLQHFFVVGVTSLAFSTILAVMPFASSPFSVCQRHCSHQRHK